MPCRTGDRSAGSVLTRRFSRRGQRFVPVCLTWNDGSVLAPRECRSAKGATGRLEAREPSGWPGRGRRGGDRPGRHWSLTSASSTAGRIDPSGGSARTPGNGTTAAPGIRGLAARSPALMNSCSAELPLRRFPGGHRSARQVAKRGCGREVRGRFGAHPPVRWIWFTTESVELSTTTIRFAARSATQRIARRRVWTTPWKSTFGRRVHPPATRGLHCQSGSRILSTRPPMIRMETTADSAF